MTDSTQTEGSTLDIEMNCIICKKPIAQGTGLGCETHRNQAKELASEFGCGIPGDGVEEDEEPPLPFDFAAI